MNRLKHKLGSALASFVATVSEFPWLVLVTLLSLAVVLGPGCAQVATGGATESINQAGITSIRVIPVEVAGTVERSYEVIMGRETDNINFTLTWDGNGNPEITVHAQGVKAFEGQAQAAQAIVAIQSELANLGVEMTPVLADALTKLLVPVQ